MGGVAGRQRLGMRFKHTVLEYKVRFARSFNWALGGTLPGLYCDDGKGLRVGYFFS